MKPCKKCGVEKELEEFYVNRQKRDGRSNVCRCCQQEIDRRRRHTIEFHNLPHQRRRWADMMYKHLRINARDY